MSNPTKNLMANRMTNLTNSFYGESKDESNDVLFGLRKRNHE